MSPAFSYRLRTPVPLVCVEDYRRAALRALPKMVWAYLDGGAEDERTLRANRDAFAKWLLRQRVLAGNAAVDTSVTLNGTAPRAADGARANRAGGLGALVG